jgi:transcription elongation factor GreA
MENGSNEYYLTKERLEELKAELNELKTVKRIEIAADLKKAKELGDLSENAEYVEAREEKDRIEKRIAEIENIIKNSSVIKKSRKKDEVFVGSEVEVLRDKEKMKLTIVGSQDSDPAKGQISNESPIGRALLGSKIGETVSIETPRGTVSYKICKIS